MHAVLDKDSLRYRRYLAPLGKYTMTTDPLSRPRILAIDDNHDTLELIRMTLQDEYDLVTLDNPVDVYQLIELFEPDLLILDIMMPRINGFQLIEMLRRSPATKQLPVIILSAKDSARDIKYGYKLGASLYLTKPFQAERLAKNVKTQFELAPPKGTKKNLSMTQVRMQLQMKESIRQGQGVAQISTKDLKEENILRRRVKPEDG